MEPDDYTSGQGPQEDTPPSAASSVDAPPEPIANGNGKRTSKSGEAPGGGRGAKRKKNLNFGDLQRLREHFVLLYGTDTVWDGETRQIIKIGALRLAFGNDAIKFWLASKERRMIPISNVVFEPGQSLNPSEWINLYDGLPTARKAGDASVMVELLYHLCSESAASDTGVEEVVQWVLRWLAYPLQHPGAKLQTALVFHGAQGTGKNLFFDACRDLYGEYGVMVSQNELEDKFTSWMSRKMFIVGDEVVTRAEMYHKKNQLKWLVTSDKKIPIRAIQQDVRWESNHCNLVFLSNEIQPLALENGDRRYLVVYTPRVGPEDLYARAKAFIEGGGLPAWLDYLMKVDLGGFVPSTKPPMTQAKADLIDLGLRPPERFAQEWLGGFLPLPVRPCSAEQLYRAFRRWADQMGERFPPTQATFSRMVNRLIDEQPIVRDSNGTSLGPAMTYKVVKLHEENGGRRCVRSWMPRGTGPRNGEHEGEWMNQCIVDFEGVLSKFMRSQATLEDHE